MSNKLYIVRYEDITLGDAYNMLYEAENGYFDGDARVVVINQR
jgi:hypothetical protein